MGLGGPTWNLGMTIDSAIGKAAVVCLTEPISSRVLVGISGDGSIAGPGRTRMRGPDIAGHVLAGGTYLLISIRSLDSSSDSLAVITPDSSEHRR